jgi:glycosyltransferase involved in cell wall biosynthesis
LCIIPGSPDLQLLTPRAPVGESEISARIRGLAKPIVSFVGRLDPIKAPHLFVLICAKLRERPASFVIAGEGPAASDITRLIRSVNLEDRVVQVGRVSYDCVGDLYRSSDVVVVPSLVDGRPLVVQEAQACGAAVVASRVGGIPELIEDGITGSLCEPGNVDDFASKIDLLLSAPAMRVSIGQQGREKVTRSGGLMASLPSYMKAIIGSDALKPANPAGRHACSRKGAP